MNTELSKSDLELLDRIKDEMEELDPLNKKDHFSSPVRVFSPEEIKMYEESLKR